ncbi:MAG: cohesin domain-containing protein [Candidatus Cloacimonetes bacterium]|nr:cohesin domain-containing protein [Candidatus Cloacimonadota bacterium]MDY0171932.1 cohesin domain-containing protein [Candidatus Cloacimonadaceae bacterium]
MNLKKLILILSLLAFAAGGIAVSVSSSPNPLVSPANQPFVLAINLDTATQIRGCSIRMGFDPAVLSFTTATKGSLFNGMPVNWWRIFNESPGVIRIEAIIFGAGLYVTGPGNLINLSFNSLAEGYSTLDFITTELYDPIGPVIPDVSSTAGNIIIGSNFSYAKAKCYLQGAYSNGLMRTDINEIVPLTSPYPANPITANSIPDDVVDWVLMELRTIPTGAVVKSQSMFLHADGQLSSPGKNLMLFPDTPAQNYYIKIKHRNHLPLISSSACSLVGSGNAPLYDFSLSSNINPQSGAVLLEPNVYALAAGDANQDGLINNLDKNQYWRIQAGQQAYLAADFDLDGQVFPNDLNAYWRLNSTNIPGNPSYPGASGLELSFSEPEIVTLNAERYLKIDILASATAAGARLGTGIILIDYNTTAFGEYLKANSAVIVSKGDLLGISQGLVYALITNDNQSNRLGITYEYFGAANAGAILQTSPQQLLSLKLKLAAENCFSGLALVQEDMDSQAYLDDNFSLFDPVLASDTENCYLPSRPQGISQRTEGNTMILAWETIPGCSYSVYSADSPVADTWSQEVTGLLEPTWAAPLTYNKRFYYVTAEYIR